MNTTNKDVKPFYIYADKNCLFIKNINEHTEKIANNIYAYSANIDDDNKIHICCIDLYGKLIHLVNHNSHWKKKVIGKVFNSVKFIKNMRLYLLNNCLNIFITEESSLSDNLFRVSHFNFTTSNYKLSKYHINNIMKNKESIFKLNIDEFSNIIFEYDSFVNGSRNTKSNTMVFNSTSKSWIHPNRMIRHGSQDFNHTPVNIKNDIFEYCYSIIYKI